MIGSIAWLNYNLGVISLIVAALMFIGLFALSSYTSKGDE